MHTKRLLRALVAGFIVAFLPVSPHAVAADTLGDAALAGSVTSADEGVMEGVLVSAK